jgi:hypothetical protein
MPPKELIITHFQLAVECTGLNLSLLAVRKWRMCLFDAAASCIFAMRPLDEAEIRSKKAAPIHLRPFSPFTLLRACFVWLLEERNVLKQMNVTMTGDNRHPSITCTILELLCEGLVAGDPTGGATLSLGEKSTEGQRLLMYKKYIIKLVEADEFDLLMFAESFLPKLNILFTQVLCELYCKTSITVIDFVSRAVRTFTCNPTCGELNKSNIRNLFLYKVAMPSEYYYGVIDNDTRTRSRD